VNNKNYTKINLSRDLSLKTGYSLNFSKKIIEDLFESIIDNINSGNFSLKNVGTFKIINKKMRKGRNPKTGEEFIISSRKSLSFSPSKKIYNKLN
tara:strand:+ start:3225 stop:3509 length:285 start_codon:yes stop_codon:yes gene_type:complete